MRSEIVEYTEGCKMHRNVFVYSEANVHISTAYSLQCFDHI